jgi:hypothetical protein
MKNFLKKYEFDVDLIEAANYDTVQSKIKEI